MIEKEHLKNQEHVQNMTEIYEHDPEISIFPQKKYFTLSVSVSNNFATSTAFIQHIQL